MKIKKSLKLSALLLSAMLVLPTSVFSASSVSGSVNGMSTYGYVSMGSSYAVGSTSASGQAMLTVSVSYTYGWGETTNRYTSSGFDNGFKTSTTAQANAQHYNPVSLYASASHTAASGQAYWSDSTSTN
ncbi:hypothetical protein [Paenibacillus aquistagni]|uniref:hypothetical protein n=1 Tax=Paenibacillus aquistagni TaxID=1852522 RepID=UPI000B503075|nr:hypothetical protein [Paenibacillus aquistagni]NMM55112.1 hypothetical protein [Paenibacillus aquistagni]